MTKVCLFLIVCDTRESQVGREVHLRYFCICGCTICALWVERQVMDKGHNIEGMEEMQCGNPQYIATSER